MIAAGVVQIAGKSFNAGGRRPIDRRRLLGGGRADDSGYEKKDENSSESGAAGTDTGKRERHGETPSSIRKEWGEPKRRCFPRPPQRMRAGDRTGRPIAVLL
jgi:hypothetical protein